MLCFQVLSFRRLSTCVCGQILRLNFGYIVHFVMMRRLLTFVCVCVYVCVCVTHIASESIDVIVVSVTGPSSIVCASLEGLNMLQR